MTLFPFFENIENKTFLIIGGGAVAKGKLSRLRQFTDRIVVIAQDTDIEGAIRKPFEEADLARGDYVIGASDDPALNARIFRLCTAQGKSVNIVDDPEKCTFVFPALIKRGDLVVGVSTSGKSPAFAQYLRSQIEQTLPADTEAILDNLFALRETLKESVPNQTERANILKQRLAELL